MTITSAAPASSTKGITFYTAADTPLLDDDGIMTPPEIDEAVTSTWISPLSLPVRRSLCCSKDPTPTG